MRTGTITVTLGHLLHAGICRVRLERPICRPRVSERLLLLRLTHEGGRDALCHRLLNRNVGVILALLARSTGISSTAVRRLAWRCSGG